MTNYLLYKFSKSTCIYVPIEALLLFEFLDKDMKKNIIVKSLHSELRSEHKNNTIHIIMFVFKSKYILDFFFMYIYNMGIW